MARAPTPAGERDGPSLTDEAPVPQTLAEVYRRYSGFVWRMVRRHGIPDAVVEDVMQEVFIVVHRRLREYDGRAAMTTWLYHLTRGVVSNYKRGRSREEKRLSLVRPSGGQGLDPETQTERQRAAGFVRRFLATLDEDKRRIFELVDIEGLAVTEAAELCGIKLNTAYSRLRAARQAFSAAAERYGTRRPQRNGVG